MTTTVLETATITASPTVHRRMMAAAQQIESIAASIVNSVIASGTPSATEVATPKGPNRIAAERGLATACSCRLVSPTSSVTSTFTVPNAAVSLQTSQEHCSLLMNRPPSLVSDICELFARLTS